MALCDAVYLVIVPQHPDLKEYLQALHAHTFRSASSSLGSSGRALALSQPCLSSGYVFVGHLETLLNGSQSVQSRTKAIIQRHEQLN